MYVKWRLKQGEASMINKITTTGLPRRGESGGFLYRLEYKLTGLDGELTRIMEADMGRFVIPAFLMEFYGPSGDLSTHPGPEYVKVFGVDRDEEPVYTWRKSTDAANTYESIA
ncbi:MAG: hypothetical protein J4451_01680 [DPANN group archaeon]|nr:hypothetical protein [DPANN group archaeon]